MNVHSPSARVLIVEDHFLMIQGIRNLLTNYPRYEVVGDISDGLAVYEACQKLSPDIIILDLNLPGMHGMDVIHQLRRRWNLLRIVVITASTDEKRGHDAFMAGAIAYVLKQSHQHILLSALQHAIIGKKYIDPSMNIEFIEINKDKRSGNTSLTLRERQILKLIAEGKRNRDISELLTISLKTVETHRLNLMKKLSAHNAVELCQWAHRFGLLEF